MTPEIKDLLSAFYDLHKQATTERSHYYVGNLVRQSIEAIGRYERDLNARDEFIVQEGLWSKFLGEQGG